MLASPRLSYEERQLGGHLSPRKDSMNQYAKQYANAAGLAPRPEMFMATPQSNYQQAFGA